MKGTIAWLLRFVNNRHINPRNQISSPFLKAPELRQALRFIIRVDQWYFFDEEVRCLKKKLPIPTASHLANLNPFLDPYGIVRVGGRIQHSSLPENTKHPIIVSSESQLSTMVISDIHVLNLHSSTEPTLHAVRTQYHILHPRSSINRVIRHCLCAHRRQSKETSWQRGREKRGRRKTRQGGAAALGLVE